MDDLQTGARWQENPEELPGAGLPGLAHDLKCWLTPVKTCLQLYEAGQVEKAEALRAYALDNLNSVLRCLDALRHRSTPAPPTLKPVALRTLLAQALTECAALGLEKNTELLLAPGAEAEIAGDDWLLRRLFLNLLANALQAAAPASQVRLELQPAGEQNPWVAVRVFNTCAPGLSAATEETLRQRLGLRICQEICRLHEGRMDIRCDEAGRTVCVEVLLPARPAKS